MKKENLIPILFIIFLITLFTCILESERVIGFCYHKLPDEYTLVYNGRYYSFKNENGVLAADLIYYRHKQFASRSKWKIIYWAWRNWDIYKMVDRNWQPVQKW